MLFRKSKVLKILREYSRIGKTTIPRNAIGVKELNAIKQVELKQLALAYDTLQGYVYFEESVDGMDINVRFNMPDYSMYKPSTESVIKNVGALALRVRLLQNLRFLRDNYFISEPEAKTPREGEIFVPSGRTLWK